MNRMIGHILALLLFFFATDTAYTQTFDLDVNPVARVEPKPGVAPDSNVVGTTWAGQDGDFKTTFHFEADGTLSYSYENRNYKNGTWKQTANSIYFEMNDKYREFKGVFKGDRIEGDSWNVVGKKWTTTITRQEK